ncbi:kinase-like domain-containing protein, partial [Halenospora varia]
EYTIIPSHTLRNHYFPSSNFNMMTLDIAFSDWGVASWINKHLTELIQPVLLCEPEVLVEAPWGLLVDIWNMGALVAELLYGQCMFSGCSKTGGYSRATHIEEILRLLETPPPKSLLESGRSKETLEEVVDENGKVKEERVDRVVGLEERFALMDNVEKPKFIPMIKSMLELDSEERPSANKLLECDWINHQST